MKNHLVAIGISVTVVAAATVSALAIDRYAHQPDPIPLVPASQLTGATEAKKTAEAKQKSLQTQLDASKVQVSTVARQKADACAALIKYRIKSEVCK